jgi:hypothetical protein
LISVKELKEIFKGEEMIPDSIWKELLSEVDEDKDMNVLKPEN